MSRVKFGVYTLSRLNKKILCRVIDYTWGLQHTPPLNPKDEGKRCQHRFQTLKSTGPDTVALLN